MSVQIGYLLVAGQLSFYGDISLDVLDVLRFKATLSGSLQLVPGQSSGLCNFIRRHYSSGPPDGEW